MIHSPLAVSTPGRICLFGEHQDYLGLPVVAAAISLRIRLQAEPTPDPAVRLSLPDVQGEEYFPLDQNPVDYPKGRDYFRSAVNVLRREGFRFSLGVRGNVRGEIPINAGTSSSSALVVSWINVLSRLADQPRVLTPNELARLAHAAEVLEFGEPGGMMDHFATAVGNIIYLETTPLLRLQVLRPPLGAFVLGDSLEAKDTLGILSRVKNGMLRIIDRIQTIDPAFSLHTTTPEAIDAYRSLFTEEEQLLLAGNLENRDILRAALELLQKPSLDHQAFGGLLNRHQQNLREAQRISTPKIDRMLDAALQAGALGGKINGSGGGGCMFAYAPDDPQRVAHAVEQAGGKAYVVYVDEGSRIETLPVTTTLPESVGDAG